MDSSFYHYQLGLLAIICIVLLAFERYLKSKKTPTDHVKIEENIENGHPGLQKNAAAMPMTSRAGALNTLMRKYLLVYSIVMGEYTYVQSMTCSEC